MDRVPNTNTFTLDDVVTVVSPTVGDTLHESFEDAIDEYFDDAYKGDKTSLYNFRNYGPYIIDPDTYIYYVLDDSGSMNLIIPYLRELIDNNEGNGFLKNTLYDFYQDGATNYYSSRVTYKDTIIHERFLQKTSATSSRMLYPEDENEKAIYMVFQDEAWPNSQPQVDYHSVNIWDTVGTYFTIDIKDYRDFLDSITDPNIYRGALFPVTSSASGEGWEDFVTKLFWTGEDPADTSLGDGHYANLITGSYGSSGTHGYSHFVTARTDSAGSFFNGTSTSGNTYAYYYKEIIRYLVSQNVEVLSGDLTVTILDSSDDSPINLATVVAYCGLSEPPATAEPVETVITNTSGVASFRFSNIYVGIGGYTIAAWKSGYRANSSAITMNYLQDETMTIKLTAE